MSKYIFEKAGKQQHCKEAIWLCFLGILDGWESRLPWYPINILQHKHESFSRLLPPSHTQPRPGIAIECLTSQAELAV
jgi:hypothetical protein